MNWHFENPEHVDLLRDEAARWLGIHPATGARVSKTTPFRPFSRAIGPGGGIDCVGLAEQLMLASRVIGPNEFIFPRHAADYQSNALYKKVLDYLRGGHPDPQSARLASIFAEIDLPEEKTNLPTRLFLPGDILILSQAGAGGALFHVPIMLAPPGFVDCHAPAGVGEGNIHDTTFSDYLEALFRARARV